MITNPACKWDGRASYRISFGLTVEPLLLDGFAYPKPGLLLVHPKVRVLLELFLQGQAGSLLLLQQLCVKKKAFVRLMDDLGQKINPTFFLLLFVFRFRAPALAQRPQLLPLLQRPLPGLHDVPSLLLGRSLFVQYHFL